MTLDPRPKWTIGTRPQDMSSMNGGIIGARIDKRSQRSVAESRMGSFDCFRGYAQVGFEEGRASPSLTVAAVSPSESTAWQFSRSVMRYTSADACHSSVAGQPYARFDVNGAGIAAFISGRLASDTIAKLSVLGFGAACRTAAETLICAYVHWGKQFADHLGESYIGALWDERHSRLILKHGLECDTMLHVERQHDCVKFWSSRDPEKALRYGYSPRLTAPTGLASLALEVADPGALLLFE